MKKRFIPICLCILALVVLSFSGSAWAPAPPSLPTATGTVKKDYVDQNKIRKVHYTVEKPDGTQCEVWSKEPELKQKIDKAAFQKEEITVWYGGDGELYALSVNYSPVY